MLRRILIAIEDEIFATAIEELLGQLSFPDFTIFRLVHVMEPADKTINWPSDEHRRQVDELMARVAGRLRKRFPGVLVEQIILEGYPADTILDDSLLWQADLIILGSHGKRGLRRFLLGSVAANVAEYARCSVLIIRTEQVAAKKKSLKKTEELVKS
jgi:nucleotide-binding universal stress UspA family protein